MVLDDRFITNAAADSEYTADELSQTAKELERAIQSRLVKHFERCRLKSGGDYWLLEDHRGRPGVWLAFNQFEFEEELRKADRDCDPGMLFAVASAYLEQFQARDLTIAIPGPVARSYNDPFFVPIHVGYPDGWEDGEWHAFQRFQELIWRYDMTPAEALDYWIVSRLNQSPSEWAGKRNVQAEAVRKNVRQASDKLLDDDLGAAHEREQIRPVNATDVPSDGLHDDEKDLFYVPTDGSGEFDSSE